MVLTHAVKQFKYKVGLLKHREKLLRKTVQKLMVSYF